MRDNWREHAACRDANPELFAPREPAPHEPGGRAGTHATIRAALTYCAACPVVAECREFADSRTDAPVMGVWAGQYRGRRLAEQRQQLSGTGPYAAVAPRRLAPGSR